MKAAFSPRLALLGIKKNARLYVPYLLSCAFMAAMLYIVAYLAATPALYTVNGKVNGAGTSAVTMVMNLGSFVVSVFIALFLFYTNSFLLRRRSPSVCCSRMPRSLCCCGFCRCPPRRLL